MKIQVRFVHPQIDAMQQPTTEGFANVVNTHAGLAEDGLPEVLRSIVPVDL